MNNKFGIPENLLEKIFKIDKYCVYCGKLMVSPGDDSQTKDWATIEHLNFDGPFYWREGLQAEDIVMCYYSCNSSRGVKSLPEWFGSSYCTKKEINKNTVAEPVKDYLQRKYK